MKQLKLVRAGRKGAVLFALMLLPQLTEAQQFFTFSKGDALVCFRRPSNPSYDVVADFSNVLSLVNLSVGTVTNIKVYSGNNLNEAYGSLVGLNWSVVASFSGSTAWSNYPANTLWFTVPRSNPGTQSTPPLRQGSSLNQTVKTPLLGIGTGAFFVSQHVDGGSTNSDNDFQVVLEPVGPNDLAGNYPQYVYSGKVEDASDNTIGDFGGQFSFSVENTTPTPFSSAIVSDFYQSVPSSLVDPTTGQTTGNCTYLGYFTLNMDGTMTFTRQSSSTTTVIPPPPPVLYITRSGNTSTISFGTTNGATYTLFFTNSIGLTTPVTSWPTNATTIAGNGATNSFMDTTTDTNRFYRVGAQ